LATTFKTIEAHGQTIEIKVDTYGTFSAWLNGENITSGHAGKDLEKVEQNAKNKTRQAQVRVDVPFVLVPDRPGDDFVRATAYSLHAGNGDVLATDDANQKIRLSYYDRRSVIEALTADELSEGKRLQREAAQAQERWAQWQKSHRFDIDARVKEAIAAERRQEVADSA
jgi:hypothetical protein